MTRLAPLLAVPLALAACSGPAQAPPPVAGPPPVTNTASDAAPAPLVTGRTCEPAELASYDGNTVAIIAIAADCTSTVASTIELELGVRAYSAAWPRRDQPLAIAVESEDSTTYALIVDAPVTAAASRPAPRKVVPPGTGKTEPEGFVFALVTDGTGVFVERCRSWGDSGSGGGEESEEWDCIDHVYFALGDPRGRKAKRVVPAPRDPFPPVFAGGPIPGTTVALRVGRDRIACTVDGHTSRLDPWAAFGGPSTPVTMIPVSATDYLLGIDRNGSRMSAARHVVYTRMHGCDEGPIVREVVAGPGRYWAERVDGSWRIHVGGQVDDVLDATGQPVQLSAAGLAWTQP